MTVLLVYIHSRHRLPPGIQSSQVAKYLIEEQVVFLALLRFSIVHWLRSCVWLWIGSTITQVLRLRIHE